MSRPKRKVPGFILRALRLTRNRQKAWRENRPHMLNCAAKGLRAIARKRANDQASLAAFVAALPDLLSPADLEFQVGYLLTKKCKNPRSIIRRLTRHGLVSFDAKQGVWIKQSAPL